MVRFLYGLRRVSKTGGRSPSSNFTDLIKLMEDGIIDTSHWISERANWNSLVKTLPIWCDSTELIKGVVDIT